jgi:3-dehydroquinate synthase
VGGGVTTDLAGYVASTLRRGIPRVNVCTTLIAMVDAGLSPKTAVNVEGFKNAIGTTSCPQSVIIDPSFLRTVDTNSIRIALPEVLKLAIVRSRPLFDTLEAGGLDLVHSRFQTPPGTEVIWKTASLFLKMKWELPFPGNKPASLRSFGHAFSRSLEELSEFTLLHGEAVATEMAVASALAMECGAISTANCWRILETLRRLGLPVYSEWCTVENIWPAFQDRFEQGLPVYFPVPLGIGCGGFLRKFSRQTLADSILLCREFSEGGRGSSAEIEANSRQRVSPCPCG